VVISNAVALYAAFGAGILIESHAAPQHAAQAATAPHSAPRAPRGYIPAWFNGAPCTQEQERRYGVPESRCFNLAGTRITFTLGRDGALSSHTS
jgi:hypothetical protein